MNKLLKQVSIFDLLWLLPIVSAVLYGFFDIIWWRDAGSDHFRSLIIFLSHVFSICGGGLYRTHRLLEGQG